MKIDILEPGKIKITLSGADMKKYELTFAELNYSQIDTKRVVWELLSKVKEESDFDFSGGSLLIEAFPSADDGCVMYFTSGIGNKKSNRSRLNKGSFGPYLFRFFSCGDLMEAAERLCAVKGKHILKSRLYLEENQYYLVLHTITKLDDLIRALLLEYGQEAKDVSALYLSEHAKLLAPRNAVESLAGKARRYEVSAG